MLTPSASRADKVLGGYPVTTVAMVTLLIFSGLKVVGVPKPKHWFGGEVLVQVCNIMVVV